MNNFDIQIEDGSKTYSDFAIKENTKGLELHDWQRESINYFFKTNKALFEVSTGAGKTFCAIEIIKKVWNINPDARVLIVVPKNVILETGWYNELYNNGISLRDIGVYYGKIKEIAKITITNMQSVKRLPIEEFEFAIFDEVHNYCTDRLFPILEYDYEYKLGLSATVERMDEAHWKLFEIFDYRIFKYTPGEALQDGVLNPFVFYNIGVNLDFESRERYDQITQELNTLMKAGGGFKKIMKSNSPIKNKMLSKMNERKDLVNNYPKKFEIVREICNKHREDKIIVFNEYNKTTSKTYWYLLDTGVKACIIHSDIPHVKREENLKNFKNDKYNVMLVSKVLDEGYNLPKIDTAIISAGNSTSRQTIQRMGRVLRKKDKNSTLYQIFCINTVEEDYAKERAKLFKELASGYKDYTEEEIEGGILNEKTI